MHEFSICEGIIAGALSELEQSGHGHGHITKTRIRIGDLHAVVFETLTFAYDTLARGTPLEGSVLEIERVPVSVSCSDCHAKGGIALPVFRCPSCGSANISVETGKELYIESLEVDIG